MVKPGLWFIGSHGIYLASNGLPSLRETHEIDAEAGIFVAYAQECHPFKMSFDEWWANKHTCYGGDDGADYISAEEVDTWLAGTKGSFLMIDSDPGGFQIMGGRTRYLPGELKKAMGEQEYSLKLQRSHTMRMGRIRINHYKPAMLLAFIGCIKTTGKLPQLDKTQEKTQYAVWAEAARRLMFHHVPVLDMQEDDLKVMLVAQLEKHKNEVKSKFEKSRGRNAFLS